MNKNFNKQKKLRKKNLDFPKKIISILVAFILLSTIISTVVSSESTVLNQIIGNKKSKENSNKFSRLIDIKTLKEKISNLKDKLTELKEKITENQQEETFEPQETTKSTNRVTRTSIMKTLRGFIELKNSGSLFEIYTNYAGIEKRNPLKIIGKTEVDINEDGKNDISAKISIFPSIEKPLNLAINFGLNIKRLDDFPDINEDFQAFTELNFPGILNSKQKGDKITFGYHSLKGEEVPSVCDVTYKYIPYILSAKRPDHSIKIDPGSSAGKSDLILILSYSNIAGEKLISELSSRVVYKPAVKSEIKIGGNGILGGSTFTFERKYYQDSNVDMFCTFYSNNTEINGFVKKLSQKVTFTLDFGRHGLIEFDTHGNPPDKIGITDSSGTNEIFFSKLPSKAALEWNRQIFFKGKADIKFYTEGEGVSLNGHLEGKNNSKVDFGISSKKALNCSAILALGDGYFALNRSNVDISIFLSANLSNKTFDLSFDLEKFEDKPFEIIFDKLVEGEIDFSLSTKFFTLSNLSLLVLQNNSTLKFGITADKIVKEKYGCLNFSIDLDYDEKNISFDLTVFSDTIFSLYGISLGFNGRWTNKTNYTDLEGNRYHHIHFTFLGYYFEYYIADDWSWGYFFFKGGFSYDTEQLIKLDGEVIGGFKGKIYVGSADDGLNISWYTDTSKSYNLTKISVIGPILGLEDFHLHVKDYINFYVSEINGSINIFEVCNESGRVKVEFEGEQSLLDINILFNLTNTSGINLSLNADDIHSDISDSELYLDLIWENSSLSLFKWHSLSDVNVSIKDLDLDISQANNALNKIIFIDNFTGFFVGYAGFDFCFTPPLNIEREKNPSYIDFSGNSFAFNISDADVYLHIDDINLSGIDIGLIELSANVTGNASISLLNISLDDNFIKFQNSNWSIRWINTTIGIDATDGFLKLNKLDVENFDVILNFLIAALFPKYADLLNFTNCYLDVNNISIKGYSNFKLSLGSLVNISKNETFNFPFLFGIAFENEINTELTAEELLFKNIKISSDLLPLPVLDFNIKNIKLNGGKVDFYFDLLNFIVIDVRNGSGLESLDIEVGIPGLLYLNISLVDKVNYMHLYFPFFDFIDTFNPDQMEFDTLNETIFLDLYIFVDKDFFNQTLKSVLPESLYNLTKEKLPDEDIGFRINNCTIKADKFRFNISQENPYCFEGYINIEAGTIDILKNGTWVQLLGGTFFSFTLTPGHLHISTDVILKEKTIKIHEKLDGDEIIFSANITSSCPNITIDLWWSGVMRNFSNLKLQVLGMGFIEIKDFIISFNNLVNISANFMSFSGTSSTLNFTLEYRGEGEGLWVDGSLGLKVVLEEVYFKIDSSISDNTHIDVNLQIPYFDITLGAEGSRLGFPLDNLEFNIKIVTDNGRNKMGIGEDEKIKLEATGINTYLEPVFWESLAPEVVMIPDKYVEGKETWLIGLREGEAEIEATCGAKEARIKIFVTEDFFIWDENIGLRINQTEQLKPHNYEAPVLYESSNETVATVNVTTGWVTAIGLGTAVITATDNTSANATSNVTVTKAPEKPPKIFVSLEGIFNVSGELITVLNYNEIDKNWYFTTRINGSAKLKNVIFKIESSKNFSLELVMPDTEIKDAYYESIKENETSPVIQSFSGMVKINPGWVPGWEMVGFGLRVDNFKLSGVPCQLKFEVSFYRLYLNITDSPSQSPDEDSGGSSNQDLSKNSSISIAMYPESGDYKIYSTKKSITLVIEKFHFKLDATNLKILNKKINVSAKFDIESITFNKLGEIYYSLTLGYGKLKNLTSKKGWGGYIIFKHYANQNAYLNIKNLEVEFNLDNSKTNDENSKIIFATQMSYFNLTRKKAGFEFVSIFISSLEYYEWINISADLNSTWNCSINLDNFFGILEGDWIINSEVSTNFTVLYDPYFEYNNINMTIFRPGRMRYFDLRFFGKSGLYLGFISDGLDLTPGNIDFQISKDQGTSNTFYLIIFNKGVTGEGNWRFEINRFSITFGSFKILNDGELTLIMNEDEGIFYIENTMSFELDLLEIKWDLNFINFGRISTGAKLLMKPGEFKCEWEDLTGEDFDKQYTIRNGIFEFETLIFTTKIGDYKIVIDRRDRDILDYANIITIKIRWNGILSFDNAIYIHTTNYTNMTRNSIIFYKNDAKLLELKSKINMKFRFDNWVRGFMNGKIAWSGKIIRKLTIPGLFNCSFTLGVGDLYGNYNEILLNSSIDMESDYSPQFNAGFTIDLKNCTEDIESDPNNLPSIQIGNYALKGSFNLKNQTYLTANLLINFQGTSGIWNLSVDNGGQTIVDEIIFKLLRDDKKRGVKIKVTGLEADKFWISGECDKGEHGVWWPKPIEHGGTLIFGEIGIWISLSAKDGDYNWVQIWYNGPVVLIQEFQNQVTIGEEVLFQAIVYGGMTPYKSYIWTFPNGQTFEQQNPTYTFLADGAHKVTLIVEDRKGNIGIGNITVIVSDGLDGNGPL